MNLLFTLFCLKNDFVDCIYCKNPYNHFNTTIENNHCNDKCIVRNVFKNKIDCTFVFINHDDNIVVIE